MPTGNALIVGAGQGLSASLARLFAREGMNVALASRDSSKLQSLRDETGAITLDCDVADAKQVEALFAQVDAKLAPLDVVVFNPSWRTRGPFVDLRAEDIQRTLAVTAFGGFLVAQQAVRRMLPKGKGAILLTGASASVKGYPQSRPHRATGQTGLAARPRRDRRDLPSSAAPTAKRMDLGDRSAALAGAVLRGIFEAPFAHGRNCSSFIARNLVMEPLKDRNDFFD